MSSSSLSDQTRDASSMSSQEKRTIHLFTCIAQKGAPQHETTAHRAELMGEWIGKSLALLRGLQSSEDGVEVIQNEPLRFNVIKVH
jgi:hypothetical protein